MSKITGNFESHKVYIDGSQLSPKQSQAIVNHSPTGFAWGYSGSGPAQLALALLLKYTDENKASRLYQEFKMKIYVTYIS